MSHENRGLSSSTVSLDMQTEPRGSYRGSNEFICKCVFTLVCLGYFIFFNIDILISLFIKKILHLDKNLRDSI